MWIAVGIIIILMLLVVGGLFWGYEKKEFASLPEVDNNLEESLEKNNETGKVIEMKVSGSGFETATFAMG